MPTPKFIECSKCGKMIHVEELAKHSAWHSEQGPISDVHRFIPEDIGIENEPPAHIHPISSTADRHTIIGTIIIASVLISIGLTFLLGASKYWWLTPVVFIAVMVIIAFIPKKR